MEGLEVGNWAKEIHNEAESDFYFYLYDLGRRYDMSCLQIATLMSIFKAVFERDFGFGFTFFSFFFMFFSFFPERLDLPLSSPLPQSIHMM